MQFSPTAKRTHRRPRHSFYLKSRPFQAQPFMIAPVLPGETMKNLLLQARCVTDPIANPLIGWWNEYYFFYVKHRDLYERDKLTEMMLNPEADLSTLDSPTKVEHYHENTTDLAINWVDMCLRRCVDEYFRAEGETTATASIGNLPAVSINQDSYINSAIDDADFITSADEVLTDAGSQFGTAVNVSEVEAALRRYQMMSQMNLTDMTYEDFLATYGVKPAKQQLHTPELIRYIKEWSYPSNTIDPTSGTPRSAVSWTVAERADKDRYFKEPGFIFGISVVRPKVYLSNLSSNAAMLMRDAYRWLPAVMADDPRTSLIKVTAGDSPLTANTDAYWVDVKDLLLYGDQFVNFALASSDVNEIALPLANLTHAAKNYPASTDVDSLFVDTNAGVGKVKQDGVVQLDIATRVSETSVSSWGGNKSV